MKAPITFTIVQTFWIAVLCFYWGGNVTQFVTGYVSTLGVILNSIVSFVVLALIGRSAIKRSFGASTTDDGSGAKGSAA
jgi:hypothetical protein